jgi:outer membrane protein assembly factor BamB
VGKIKELFQLLDETSKEALRNKYDSSTILVSTIDGYLTAIDVVSGAVKWRYNEGENKISSNQ